MYHIDLRMVITKTKKTLMGTIKVWFNNKHQRATEEVGNCHALDGHDKL